MSAKDVMKTTGLAIAKPNETILDAVKKMREHNVGSTLIVDESGKLVGIFTERDLVRVVAEGIPLDTKLEKVMTKKLITAKPDEPLPLIAHKMIEHHIRHIPVVDNEGRLLGVISIRRVLRHIVASYEWP